MHVRALTTPRGEELVVLSREEFEDLVDARDAAMALVAHAHGDDPGLTDAEMDDYLAAPSPLAYWRKRRGLTQTALAGDAAISQPYLAQIEGGQRTGEAATLARLARALRVRIEDLLME